MCISRSSIPGVLISSLLVFACSDKDGIGVQSFEEESFPDLSAATVQSLETPYSSTFKGLSGGRVAGEIITLTGISEKLAQIFPEAVVIEAESEEERGLQVWGLKLKMPGGGILKIKFVKELGLIIKMKGKSGPFDYEIDPQGSFIKFSEAKKLALETMNGEIQSWSLELEEENHWEYEFHIVKNGKRYEVEIKGFEAGVLSVKEKHDGEDEDNDGEEEKDEDEHAEEMPAPEAVINLALDLFPGIVKHIEKHEHEGESYWKVYVQSEAGSVVKFKIMTDPVKLVGMEGEKGPFDYNIVPGNNLISLASALEIVNNEVDGEVDEWSLSKRSHGGETFWVYEIEIHSLETQYEAEINAATGEFIKFESHG